MFDERNQGLRRADEPIVDLHGLHVKEALYFLESTLAELRRDGYRGPVYIITGTGHHSASGRARLAPAVQRWLMDARFAPRDVSTDRLGGMLSIRLN